MDNNTTKEVESESDIKMKYCLARQEAEMWKQKYLATTNEKVEQLTHIESSLMFLEARLQAERQDIQKKFIAQNKTIKEQKKKISKLTTANQKLLTSLMTLSQNVGIEKLSLYRNKENELEKSPSLSSHRSMPSSFKHEGHSRLSKENARVWKNEKNRHSSKTHRSKSLLIDRPIPEPINNISC